MSSHSKPAPGWEQFRDKVAAIAEVAPAQVTESTRVVEDLGLDSLALTELVVMLIDDYGMTSLYAGLETKSWQDTAAGELLAESRQGTEAAGRP